MKVTMRGAVEWASGNPVLAVDEIGVEAVRVENDGSLIFEVDPETGQAVAKFKSGDGQNAWNALPYAERLLFISKEEFLEIAEEAKRLAAEAKERAAEADKAAASASEMAKAAEEKANSRHAASHAATGADPVTPDMIGAALANHEHDWGGAFNTREVITTSGTFIAPVTGFCKITCIGAGGAGGNGVTSVAGGGGGGGGAGYVAAAYIYLTAGQAIPITIGAGSVGSNGGATSFGSLLIVNGGVKGVDGASAMGGIGGAGQCKGSPGGNGFSSGTSTGGLGGDGGNNGTDFGSGGGGGGGGGTIQPQGGSGQANGDNGVKPAGTTGGTGGKGGPGAIEIEYNDPLKSAE